MVTSSRIMKFHKMKSSALIFVTVNTAIPEILQFSDNTGINTICKVRAVISQTAQIQLIKQRKTVLH